MLIRWRLLWTYRRTILKTAWLITATLAALYITAIEPLQRERNVAAQRASGLASFGEPVSLWRSGFADPLISRRESRVVAGIVGGIPGGIASAHGAMAYLNAPADTQADTRKLVRTAAIDLIVKNPAATAEKICQLAETKCSFLVSSQTAGQQEATSASLTVRVPAERFEEVRADIRNLALRVEGERIEALDVTKQYVDDQARLRNLHAQETQYLAILRQAKTVKETLEVSDKLNEVRGEIEQQQAEFDALSKQVETVALTISLRAEIETQVWGLHWRPLYQLKSAARDGLDGVGEYVAMMTAFLFYLPTVLLWLATILVVVALAWRLLRRATRWLFVSQQTALTGKVVSE